jgi:hypothetical protein
MSLFHYTDRTGFNGIRSQPIWNFKAARQRSSHLPPGAFFTLLKLNKPTAALFFARTRIPRSKRGFVFQFRDAGDLIPLDGDRGRFVLYSPVDIARWIIPWPRTDKSLLAKQD